MDKASSCQKGLAIIPLNCLDGFGEDGIKNKKINLFGDSLNEGKKDIANRMKLRSDSYTIQEGDDELGKHLNSLPPNGGFTEVFDFRHDEQKNENKKLLQIHLKAENNTVIPFVKRFINRLKGATSFRNIQNLKPFSIKILSDKSFFFEDFQKKQQITETATFFQRSLLIFLNFYESKLYEFKRSALMGFWKETVLGSKMVFHPYHLLKIIWDLLHLLLMIAWFFYIPLILAFEEANQIESIFSFFTCIFLLSDIFISANTAYFKNGLVERNRGRVISHYMRTRFPIDFLTAFPTILDQILHINYDTLDYGNLLYLHLAKFLFFLKIQRLNEITHRINKKFLLKEQLQSILSLFKVFFVSILVAHLFACFWYFVSKHSREETTWLVKANLTQSNWGIIYLYSMYWACVTMMTVGYGDITPQNEVEMIVCMISVILGCGVYAYNISSIGMLLQDYNKDNIEFEHNINIINQYMNRKNISRDLQMRIQEYLRFIWKEENTQNLEGEQKIISLLSNSLREELLIEAYGDIMKKYPMFFANFTEKSLRKVVSIIRDIKLFPEEKIFSENEVDDCSIYFIMKGKVELYTESRIIIRELGVGEHFGELAFFSGKCRKLSARSKDFTTLFSINRNEFIEVLMKNSDDLEKFCMIKDQMIFYGNYFPLKLHCYSCNQIGHLSDQCPLIHFIADKEKIIKTFNFYLDQDRNPKVDRRMVKKNSRFLKSKLGLANGKIKAKIKTERILSIKGLDDEDMLSMSSSERSFLDSFDDPIETLEAVVGIGSQPFSTEKANSEAPPSTYSGLYFDRDKNKHDEMSLTNIAEEYGEDVNRNAASTMKTSIKQENQESFPNQPSKNQIIYKSAENLDENSQQGSEEMKSDQSLPNLVSRKPPRLICQMPMGRKGIERERKANLRPMTEIVKREQTYINLQKKQTGDLDGVLGETALQNRQYTKKVSSGIAITEGKLSNMNNSNRMTLRQQSGVSKLQEQQKGGTMVPSYPDMHQPKGNHISRASNYMINTEAAMDNFDRVASFKNYFPEHNSKFLFEKINRKLYRLRSLRWSYSRKRSIEGKLSKYTFFPETMKQKMPNEIRKKARRLSKQKKKQKTEADFTESHFKEKWFDKSQSKLMKTKKTKTMILSGRFFEEKFSDLVKYIMRSPSIKKNLKKQKRKSNFRGI